MTNNIARFLSKEFTATLSVKANRRKYGTTGLRAAETIIYR